MASTVGTRERLPAGCSKRPSSKAAGESKPEAYPLGYVEDFNEPRTTLAGFFSILLGNFMAHSYTPGLTVTEQAVVSRRRILSLPGSVLVTSGETVRANQAVARAELPGKVYPLNLANQLSVAPDEIHDYL